MMDDYKNSKTGRNTARKYADILHAERPAGEDSLRKHPRMSAENRAKIFSPFAALRGYEDKVSDEGRKALRVRRQELTEEDAARLNTQLARLRSGMTVTAVFFCRDADSPATLPVGSYRTLTAKVDRLDAALHRFRLGGEWIAFEELAELRSDELSVT